MAVTQVPPNPEPPKPPEDKAPEPESQRWTPKPPSTQVRWT